MIIDYLIEEFLTGEKFNTPHHKGYAEIYTNPTYREIRDVARADDNDEQSVRLGVTADGTVYAWIYTILHDEMSKYLKKDWALRFEYNFPQKDLWLGADTSPEEWEKYGTDKLITILQRGIPGLNKINYSDNDDIAWEI